VPFEVIIDVLALANYFWSEIIEPMEWEEVYGNTVVRV
jgi:hypothetical protein